jgi:hypothetical protein
MKRVMIGMLVLAIVAGLGIAFAEKPADNGNGAPSGKHYNLNIIGVPNEKNANFDGGNGSRIFVLRTGQTLFYVYGGDAYEVKDHDGTDGKVGQPGRGYANAGIVLPYLAGAGDPCEGDGGAWQVEIWVRLVGPKDSSIHMKSEYFDGSEWLLVGEFNLDKSSKFSLKTGALLKDGYRDIIWTLDQKNKFRNLQMRIYEKD